MVGRACKMNESFTERKSRKSETYKKDIVLQEDMGGCYR